MRREQVMKIADKMRFDNGVSAVSKGLDGNYYLRAVMYVSSQPSIEDIKTVMQKLARRFIVANGAKKGALRKGRAYIISADNRIYYSTLITITELDIRWKATITAVSGCYIVTFVPEE